jgi:hypothetical protein
MQFFTFIASLLFYERYVKNNATPRTRVAPCCSVFRFPSDAAGTCSWKIEAAVGFRTFSRLTKGAGIPAKADGSSAS